ncbi:MAG: NusG domain II-containing protein [Oliverpabstia sp.]|nr:NusG domain II-containing protein [Lachnospiraceae bacterium]MDY5025913.1 NusG domain II-containing protein [Oliverpabstia sp.]
MMKRRDWIAAAVILAAALIIALVSKLTAEPAQALRITVNGETYGIYDITEDQEIKINDTNICQIENGKVRMTGADCPDQICVHTAEISKDGGSIICLPNRIVLEIISEVPENTGEKVDVISS